LDNIRKAWEIYDFLGSQLEYKRNLFDRLRVTPKNVFSRENKLDVYNDMRVCGIKPQTIQETYSFGAGDCDALSSLFASSLICAGIDSSLLVVISKDPNIINKGEAHMVVLFDNGYVDRDGVRGANVIDPSYLGKKSFVDNLKFSAEYLRSPKFDVTRLE